MNIDYFKVIDTPEKAYYLGLLRADGSISKRLKGNYEEIRLQISLIESDIHILYSFCDEISIPKSRVKIYNAIRKNEQNICKLYIATKEFTKNLLDLKSSEILNKIPKQLIRHFIRGFFDGDGGIHIRESKDNIRYSEITFTAFKDDVEFIMKNLPFQIGAYKDKRTEGLYNLSTNKQESLIKMYNYIYTGCKHHRLNRKFDKFSKVYIKCIQSSSTTIPTGEVEPSGSK